jgi:hypothetical protein
VFINAKSKSLFLQRKKPTKIVWTLGWRRMNKKIKVRLADGCPATACALVLTWNALASPAAHRSRRSRAVAPARRPRSSAPLSACRLTTYVHALFV